MSTKYQDGCIEVSVYDTYLQIHQTSEDFYVSIDFKEAEELLESWSPHMKSRAPFFCQFRNKNFRSYDVKSIVRVLRKILKTRVKTKKIRKESLRFRVSITHSKESCGIKYWVLLENGTRPPDAKFFDHKGQLTPFRTENFEHAQYEAKVWADFLGVEVNCPVEYPLMI